MNNRTRQVATTLLGQVFPQQCILCEVTQPAASTEPICRFCRSELPRSHPYCAHCGTDITQGASRCMRCAGIGRDKHQPKLGLVTPLNHITEARQLVHQLKYAGNRRAAQVLAAEIAGAVAQRRNESLEENAILPDALIPVPASWRRQVRRGYNQADWLAYYLGKTLAIKVHYRAVRRKHTPAQSTLNRRNRLALPRNTFSLVKDLAEQHVVIIDDVFTTGATANAMVHALRQAGVKKVACWCATKAQQKP